MQLVPGCFQIHLLIQGKVLTDDVKEGGAGVKPV